MNNDDGGKYDKQVTELKRVLIKLLFGASDLVIPLGEMIRAVARTRVFPDSGKVAKQIFCWKGKGVRNKLGNCRTITMANDS